MAEAPLLELRGITKRFPGVLANDDVNFDLRAGEVHALLGENGAGKSTLMNVLYGLYAPDEGEIFVDDEPVRFGGPGDAMAARVGTSRRSPSAIGSTCPRTPWSRTCRWASSSASRSSKR